jgi:catechol 2,3-dioxygenase-like lactoylglutathione lyase family enzyme
MRLHHVSIPIRKGEFDIGRDFYGGVFGLREIPTPETLGNDRVLWFELGGSELHLFIEDEPNARPSGRHFAFQVDDLASVRAALEARQVTIEETTPIHNRPRFFAHDPWGNQLEVTQIDGPYR